MAKELWLPGRGNVMIEKNVQAMSRSSLQTISRMHDVNVELGDIEVRCLRCGNSFQGANNGNERVPSISCGCREIRYNPDLR